MKAMRYLPPPQSSASKSRPLISWRLRANFRTASLGISRTISPERSSAIFTMKRFSCSSLEIIALVGAFSNAELSVSIASLISSATPSMDLRELSLSDFAALANEPMGSPRLVSTATSTSVGGLRFGAISLVLVGMLAPALACCQYSAGLHQARLVCQSWTFH